MSDVDEQTGASRYYPDGTVRLPDALETWVDSVMEGDKGDDPDQRLTWDQVRNVVDVVLWQLIYRAADPDDLNEDAIRALLDALDAVPRVRRDGIDDHSHVPAQAAHDLLDSAERAEGEREHAYSIYHDACSERKRAERERDALRYVMERVLREAKYLNTAPEINEAMQGAVNYIMWETQKALSADADADAGPRKRTPDSPRWCDECQAWGDHHTDRHPTTERYDLDCTCSNREVDARGDQIHTADCAMPPDVEDGHSRAIFDDEGRFHGHRGGECEEHRTVGHHRAWCFDCQEWCYPGQPCASCERPMLEARAEEAERERDVARRCNERLRADNDRLREALRPFAEFLDALDAHGGHDPPDGWLVRIDSDPPVTLTIEELHRARAALSADAKADAEPEGIGERLAAKRGISEKPHADDHLDFLTGKRPSTDAEPTSGDASLEGDGYTRAWQAMGRLLDDAEGDEVPVTELLQAALDSGGVAVVTGCPDCGFTYDAMHVDERVGGYWCPACEAKDLEKRLMAARAALEDSDG